MIHATNRQAKLQIVTGVMLLIAIGATASHVYSEPRLLTLCLLAALPTSIWFWSVLSMHASRRTAAPSETPVMPGDQYALTATLSMFETFLEHAPVALYKLDSSNDADRVVPLNIMARRSAAPGRAIDTSNLYRKIFDQAVGERNMIEFETEHGIERTLVSINEINLHGSVQRLAALIPLESQLEAAALHAWREMTHVLTHEIMNSLTPIASLSHTACDLLGDLLPTLPADQSADLVTALDTIGRRADSLANFVANYRTLSNIPAANPELVGLNNLFSRLSALLSPSWTERGGRIEFSVEPESLELMVDPGQFEQALINLIQNAADATAQIECPLASVNARLSRGGRLRLEVADNGPGVADSAISHIFTPFFSTKENGSGIGLAMVRQLVHGNGGTVRYAKSLQAGARFILTF